MPLSKLKPGGDKATSFPGDQFPAKKLTIRYKGPFDYTYMCRSVQRWFEQRRFRFYEERVKDTGKRIKVDWRGRREIDEFFAENYKVKVEMWNLSSKEVMVNGEPRKILNGMINIDLSGDIETDRNKWFSEEKGWFAHFLGKLYMDMRWREIESNYIDVMEYRVHDIQTFLKECLNMTTKENAAW